MSLIKTKLNGLDFWYKSNDTFIGQRIALGKYEEYETMLMLSQVNSNSVVVDVGANIGYYTLLLAQKCKLVYAIEPEAETFEILQKNVTENKLNNVVLIRSAVGEKNGKINLFKSRLNNGDHRVWGEKIGEEVEEVFCRRLDDILENEQKIDSIKIDTQGWEPAVIEGSKKIIERDSPTLFMEYSPTDYAMAGLEGRKMIKYLRNVYSTIWEIDHWFYIYRKVKKNIRLNKDTGYANLWMKRKVGIFDEIIGYKNVQWKKVIKKLIGRR